VLVAACQTTTPKRGTGRVKIIGPGDAQAFYWEAKAPSGARLYLLGSVHIGDGRAISLDPRIEQGFAAAQELVVELDMTATSPIDAVESVNRHGLLPEPRTLREVVRADTYQQVAQYMKTRGVSMDYVDQMRPWFAALKVYELEIGAAGWNAENGVDALMIGRARGAKPIFALESLDEQMSAFAGLPDSVQEMWLGDALREAQSLPLFTQQMLTAWESGDDGKMSALLFPPTGSQADQQQFFDRMFWSRNRVMTDRLMALAADGRSRFVVIGTGHLLGDQGIPELLAARGYDVARLGTARVVRGGEAIAQPSPPSVAPAVAPAPVAVTPAAPPTTAVESATQPLPATVAPAPAAAPVATPADAAPLAPALTPPLATPPGVVPAAAPPGVHDQWLGVDAGTPATAPLADPNAPAVVPAAMPAPVPAKPPAATPKAVPKAKPAAKPAAKPKATAAKPAPKKATTAKPAAKPVARPAPKPATSQPAAPKPTEPAAAKPAPTATP
jgi:hypothetical protein